MGLDRSKAVKLEDGGDTGANEASIGQCAERDGVGGQILYLRRE